jgi:hypothetical protein
MLQHSHNPDVFIIIIIIIVVIASGVGLSPCTAATSGLLYQPQMIGEGDCGPVDGMRIDRRSRSTRRKPAPAPLCSPQIQHDLIEPGPQRLEVSN